jgi:hypothetical protein
MAGGRPPKYGPKLLEAAREYLKEWKDDDEQALPTIAGLALHIGVARETCHVWAKDEDKAEFSHIYRDLMAQQNFVLANKGITGEFNSTITKLMLTKHGLSDKSEVKADIDAVIDVNWEVTVVGE